MSVYDGIMTGFNEVIECERGNLKVKTRILKILPPPTFTREEIRGIGNQLMFSQKLFQLIRNILFYLY